MMPRNALGDRRPWLLCSAYIPGTLSPGISCFARATAWHGMATERLIRKYANRRLYDTTASRHVTLDDIRKMIATGERVKVVEDKGGEDVTRAMLLQIVANEEQFGTPVLSTQLLEALIRFYGNPIQEMLSQYLEQSINGMLRQQQLMQTEMAKALGSPLAPLADFARQNFELWAKMQASVLSAVNPKPPPQRAGPAAAEPQDGPHKRSSPGARTRRRSRGRAR